MTEVDTSIYKNIYQPPSPVETLGKVADTASTLIDNRLMQQKLAGQTARAKSYVANPDGSINYPATRMNLLQSGAPYEMQELNSEALSANQPQEVTHTDANGNIQTYRVPAQNWAGIANPQGNKPLTPKSVKDVNDVHGHMNEMSTTLGGLVSKPDLSSKDIISATADLVASGRMSPQKAAMEFSSMPHNPDGTVADDPEVLRKWVGGYLGQVQQAHQQFTQAYGGPSQNMGGNSPEMIAEMPMNDDAQPPSPAGQAPPMGNPAGPPVGYEGKQAPALHHLTQVRQDAESAPQQLAIIGKLQNLSKMVGTGPGTEDWNQIRATLAATGLAPEKLNDKAAMYQELGKYAAQLAQSAGMPGSDERLEALQSANPNTHMLPSTIQSVSRFLGASAQGKIAKENFYNKRTNGSLDPDKTNSAQQEWDNNYDPRAVELTKLDPNELHDYFKSLGKDREKVMNSYRFLKKNGLVGK